MNRKNLFDNDHAAEGLPMRLVVTVILLAVIIGLSAKAVTLFINDANEKKLIGELEMIEKHASVMYIQGGAKNIDDPLDFSGTVEYIHVEIPDTIEFVAFGGMPSYNNNSPDAGNLHADNAYYYILKDGRVQTRPSMARFFSYNGEKPLVLYPGEYYLKMELIKNKNGTYVRIE